MLLQKSSSINNLKTPVFNRFVLSSNQLQLFVTIDIHNANIQVTIIYIFLFQRENSTIYLIFFYSHFYTLYSYALLFTYKRYIENRIT